MEEKGGSIMGGPSCVFIDMSRSDVLSIRILHYYYPLVFSGLSNLVTRTEECPYLAENSHSDGIWCVLFSLGNKLAYLRRELQMGQFLCKCIVIGYFF